MPLMEFTYCAYVRKDQTPCKAPALVNSSFCRHHQPTLNKLQAVADSDHDPNETYIDEADTAAASGKKKRKKKDGFPKWTALTDAEEANILKRLEQCSPEVLDHQLHMIEELRQRLNRPEDDPQFRDFKIIARDNADFIGSGKARQEQLRTAARNHQCIGVTVPVAIDLGNLELSLVSIMSGIRDGYISAKQGSTLLYALQVAQTILKSHGPALAGAPAGAPGSRS